MIVKTEPEEEPGNPNFLSLTGNIHEWNSFQSDAQLALESYRKAFTPGSQWLYTWSALVPLKYRMSEFDQESRFALHNAK